MGSDTPNSTLITRMSLHRSVRSVASERAVKRYSESRDTGLMLELCLIVGLLLIPISNAVATTTEQKELYKLYAHTKLLNHKQYLCLEKLWDKESKWSSTANNSKSSAHGIPQLLKSKEQNPFRQVDKGIEYITKRYGSACKAYAHHLKVGHY